MKSRHPDSACVGKKRDFGFRSKPQGSKDPNNRVLGSKYLTVNGIWALKPHYLGPWTLRKGYIRTRGLGLPGVGFGY